MSERNIPQRASSEGEAEGVERWTGDTPGTKGEEFAPCSLPESGYRSEKELRWGHKAQRDNIQRPLPKRLIPDFYGLHSLAAACVPVLRDLSFIPGQKFVPWLRAFCGNSAEKRGQFFWLWPPAIRGCC